MKYCSPTCTVLWNGYKQLTMEDVMNYMSIVYELFPAAVVLVTNFWWLSDTLLSIKISFTVNECTFRFTQSLLTRHHEKRRKTTIGTYIRGVANNVDLYVTVNENNCIEKFVCNFKN